MQKIIDLLRKVVSLLTDIFSKMPDGAIPVAIPTYSLDPVTNEVSVTWALGPKLPDDGLLFTIPDTPFVKKVEVPAATPTTVEITGSSSFTGTAAAAAAFSVTVAGSSGTVSSTAIVGGKMVLTLASAVTTGQAVLVTYTQPASNKLADAIGRLLPSFTGFAATNSVAA